jgi:adenylate cyclase
VAQATQVTRDARQLGKAFDARYVVEGSIRKSGTAIRLNAQLIDTSTGTALWAEAYDRSLAEGSVFGIQDDLTDRIVATVADPLGVLVRTMAASIRDRLVEELTASELVIRYYGLWYQMHPVEHERLRHGLELALEREPDHAEGWAALSAIYWGEEVYGINTLPDALERAHTAAQRAIEANRSSHFAVHELACVAFFQGDVASFRTLAERSLAMNPRSSSTGAFIANLMTFCGDLDRGHELARRFMAINPHHAGWYHAVPFNYHFNRGEFAEALVSAKRINMPELVWMWIYVAIAAAELGQWNEVRAATDKLQTQFPWVFHPTAGAKLASWFRNPEMAARHRASFAKALAGPPASTSTK